MPACPDRARSIPTWHRAPSKLEVIHNLFESLVTLDAGNATRPMLAAKAAASEDFKTYSFELRKGVKFHNGQEMTSADVKASFERYRRISPAAKNLERSIISRRPIPTASSSRSKSPMSCCSTSSSRRSIR
jgi:peptide/nickel transport system substrate-binding protein